MSISLKCHGRVKGFCISQNCKSPRMFCLNCMKDHMGHDDSETCILEIEDLEKWLSEKFTFSQQLLSELDKLRASIQSSLATLQKYINQFVINPNIEQGNLDLQNFSLTQLNNVINQNLKLSNYSTYIQNLISPFSIEFENILKPQTQINQKMGEMDQKNNIQQYLKIGDILRGHEYYKEAVKIYEVAAQLNNKEYLALWNIADCLKKQRYFDEAIKYYKQALDCPSQNKEGSLLGIGLCLIENQNLDDAEIYLKKTLAANPNIQAAKAGLIEIQSRKF